jgi:hypothetical protein
MKNTLTIKEKAKLEVKNVFGAYELLYSLRPEKNFSDMDEHTLKNIHYLLMKNLTGHPPG